MDIIPVDLFYEEVGQGEPVVLLHGYPLDHTIWAPVVEGMKNEARFILPDLRGFGKSPDTNEIYTMRLLAEDLRVLLDKLGLERVILVGHSMGGYIALSFAHAYPGYLSGFGLVSTQADADSPEKRQSRLVAARDARRRGMASIAKNMAPRLTQDAAVQKQLFEIMMRNRVPSMVNALKGMAERCDANPWLGAVKVPAVVIAGGQDQLIPIQKSQTMAQMLYKGWLVEIPDAGHVPMLERPAAVMDALRQLIGHSRGNK